MNRPTAPLGTIAREWLRIGLIGFGGPPAHVTLLRELVVRKNGWMDAPRVRGRERRLLPAPGSLLDTALDLLRLSGRRADGSGRRRARVRRPGRRDGDRALGAVPLLLAAGLGPRRRRRGRRGGGGGRRARRQRAGRPELPPRDGGSRSSSPLARLPARRSRGGDRDWALPRPRPGRLRGAGDDPAPTARRGDRDLVAPAARDRLGRRDRRPGLDGLQGRRALVRRAAS